MASTCRSCNAPIRWVLTGDGKRMPLDLEPVETGNVEVVGETRRHLEDGGIEVTPVVRVLKKGEGETLPGLAPPERYVSHFATCPNAAQHRRR